MVIIDKDILNKWPDFTVSVTHMECAIFKSPNLEKALRALEDDVMRKYKIEDIINIPTILSGRNAYKAFKKDPSRYRLSVESLYRRIVKGNRVYRINNIVDTGNLLSIVTMKPVAVLDYDKIKGDIHIRLGTDGDDFQGIGRGRLNIENIPVYEDDISPFGSSTSDTERTMIRDTSRNILVFVVSFTGYDERDNILAKQFFEEYTNALIERQYIKK